MDTVVPTPRSKHRQSTATLQRSVGEALLDLLSIKPGESVLDVGCGNGCFTGLIKEINEGARVAAIDPSESMIAESREAVGEGVEFFVESAESMAFKEEFDVLFCNSVFELLRNIDLAISNMKAALKKGGRLGIQAPATSRCSPNFASAVGESTRKDPIVRKNVTSFKNPWFWRETPEQYAEIFEKAGFKVDRSEFRHFETLHTKEEVFQLFCSGAIAGYMNPESYSCPVSEEYLRLFQERVKESLYSQADSSGMVKLFFHRIFLVAQKAA